MYEFPVLTERNEKKKNERKKHYYIFKSFELSNCYNKNYKYKWIIITRPTSTTFQRFSLPSFKQFCCCCLVSIFICISLFHAQDYNRFTADGFRRSLVINTIRIIANVRHNLLPACYFPENLIIEFLKILFFHLFSYTN